MFNSLTACSANSRTELFKIFQNETDDIILPLEQHVASSILIVSAISFVVLLGCMLNLSSRNFSIFHSYNSHS
jgi:hypothetical protein